ncbi:MAG: hypothetical protein V1838_02335 [Patescibacteria group bacterium]
MAKNLGENPNRSGPVYSMPNRFLPKDAGGGGNFLVILIILIVVALLAGGVVYYILSSDSNDNTNVVVNTPQNSGANGNTGVDTNASQPIELLEAEIPNNGSTILTPDGWEVAPNVFDDTIFTMFNPIKDQLADGSNMAANIIIELRSVSITSVSDYVDDKIEEFQSRYGDWQTISRSSTTISGREATIVEASYTSLQMKVRTADLFVIAGDSAYMVTFSTLDEIWSRYEDDVDTMLKSFKPAVISNSNTNTNTNTNGNTNGNVNINTNGNQNSNTNLNTNTGINPLPLNIDTDGDGLTKLEEIMYGTNDAKPDSDSDGFIDGYAQSTSGVISGEIALGYNPAGDGRIKDTEMVTGYSNPNGNYSVIYPADWKVEAALPDNSNIMFTPVPATGEFIQIITSANANELSARSWYLSLNPTSDPSQIESISINGLAGVRSIDGYSVYLSKADSIYILTYNFGNLEAINFRATFEMMLQSFKLISTS